MASWVSLLQVRNYKAARNIEIRFPDTPSVLKLIGPNKAGKTSGLDALTVALRGQRDDAVSADPLTEGELAGETTILLKGKLEGLKVIKRYKEGGKPTLSVKMTGDTFDNAVKWGQTELSAIWNEIAADPARFARMGAAEKLEVIKRLAGVDHCRIADALAAEEAQLVEKRRDTNRDIKRMGSVPKVDPPEGEPIDTDAMVMRLQEANDHNARQADARHQRERLVDAIDANKRKCGDLRQEIDRLLGVISQLEQQQQTLFRELGGTPEPEPDINPAPLQQELREAQLTNSERAARQAAWLQSQQQSAQLDTLIREASRLDKAITGVREDQEKHARKAQLPIPGLAWDSRGATLDGKPIADLSQGENWLFACQLAMATEPELRLLIIREGMLVDEINREWLYEEVIKRGFWLAIELATVHADTEDGDVIEIVEGRCVRREVSDE